MCCSQEIYDPSITLPDPAKARSYVAGLLVKCGRHVHAVRFNAKIYEDSSIENQDSSR